MSLLETNTVKEREYFLRSLHYCELTAEKTNQYNLERYESYKEVNVYFH